MPIKILLCSLAFLLPVLAAPARAAEADPLWLKVVAHLDAARQFVPDETLTTLELERSQHRSTRKISRKLGGWVGQKPVYATVASVPPLSPDDEASLQLNELDAHRQTHETWLRADSAVRRRDGQGHEGLLLTTFDSEYKGLLQSVLLRVWADPVTGRPHHVDVNGRFAKVLSTGITTHYLVDDQGRSLPAKVIGQIKVDAMGSSHTTRFDLRVDSWAPIP